MTDRFASSLVSNRHHLVVSGLRNWGRFITGRNAKWNRKCREFPNFRKKGQPQEVDRNFRNEFPEIFCSFDFEPEFSEIVIEWNVFFIYFPRQRSPQKCTLPSPDSAKQGVQIYCLKYQRLCIRNNCCLIYH